MRSLHLARVEELLRRSEIASDSDIKTALARLSVELRDRLTSGSPESRDFFMSTVRALSRMKGSGHAELRIGCFFECGHYFYTSGYPGAAIQTAKYVASLARKIGTRDWMRKAETLLGVTYADTGSVSEAIVHYARALDIARELGDANGVTIVLVNIGVAFNYAGLFREAIPILVRAKELAEVSPSMQVVLSRAQGNLAQSYLYTNDFEKGIREVEASLVGSGEPTNADEALSRTVREATYAQLAIELGRKDLARRRVLLCKKYAHQSGTLRSVLVSRMTDALYGVFYKQPGEQLLELEKCAQEALTLPAQRQQILTVLVKALDASGESRKALDILQVLLRDLSTARHSTIRLLLSLQGETVEFLQETDLQESLASLKTRELMLRAKVAEANLAEAQLDMLDRFATSADLKEEASGEHGYRVGRLSSLLAEEMGWDRESCRSLDIAARLHDIGKIGIPDRVLLASESLKEAERHLMCSHTLIGSELLARSNIPQLQRAEEIARCHHEWWNGEGYPAKLRGERIPIHARIVALADVFDAMTHGRPYETAWPIERALEQIRGLRGTQFDPELTDRFIALVERLRRDHDDLDEFLGRGARNSPFLQARRRIRELVSADPGTGTPVRGNETRH
jgi:putative two-component system response regulator